MNHLDHAVAQAHVAPVQREDIAGAQSGKGPDGQHGDEVPLRRGKQPRHLLKVADLYGLPAPPVERLGARDGAGSALDVTPVLRADFLRCVNRAK